MHYVLHNLISVVNDPVSISVENMRKCLIKYVWTYFLVLYQVMEHSQQFYFQTNDQNLIRKKWILPDVWNFDVVCTLKVRFWDIHKALRVIILVKSKSYKKNEADALRKEIEIIILFDDLPI